jgi:putative oxidoreductase
MEHLPTPDQLNFGLLLLRLVVGPVFAFHGFAKIFRGGRLEGTARWFDGIGLRPGRVHARVAAACELVTGACLTLGLLTTLAGMGLVGLMSVAFWTVHRGRGLLVLHEGWEYILVLATIGVARGWPGAGRRPRGHEPPAAGARAGGGGLVGERAGVAGPRPRRARRGGAWACPRPY